LPALAQSFLAATKFSLAFSPKMKHWSQTRVRVAREGERKRTDAAETAKDRNLESQTHCFGCGGADG